MTWLAAFKGKNIVVLGAGMTGLSCFRFLLAQGLSFAVNDSRPMPFSNESEANKYRESYPNVNFAFGQWHKGLITQADIIVASPGIDLVKEGITEMISADCLVIGDIELFCLVNNSLPRPMDILAVTGSNGKSTVVSLLAYIANELGIKSALAGNIGEPILDLLLSEDEENNVDLVIVELSSFQLETLKSMRALAASVLNLSDDHLDRHKTLAVYQGLKQSVYLQAKIAVVNRDDSATQTLVPNQTTLSFGLDTPEEGHFGIAELEGKTTLMFGGDSIIALESLPLAGMHNALNYLAVLALGYSAGWSLTAITEKLPGFIGLPHRCQRVKSEDDIQWINDSKATNVGATLAAISGLAPTLPLSQQLILIAGGDGKGADFSPLQSPINTNVSKLITLGKDGDAIASLRSDSIRVNSLNEAVAKAKTMAKPGDMVLLSPACASIDMFPNYMIRGEQFIAAVQGREVSCH